ncbi:MAG TPA: type II toxin-antitoxin system PemK/MazF family toxin [Kineosporiaceae bacterium]|nr:type II toxin-antitoxin system PemK/MazF family toxin [Kineosporiaceae bacterium]
MIGTARRALARILASVSSAGPTDGGDEPGRFQVQYRPDPDGRPDPGEVVWTWVPFEEDRTQGKDRPVLIMGRHAEHLLGLMLTSKDHDRDLAREAASGRIWMDLGAGPWDRQGRPSEVRLDRVLRLDPARVRREGATLDRPRFDAVAAAMGAALGWTRDDGNHTA